MTTDVTRGKSKGKFAQLLQLRKCALTSYSLSTSLGSQKPHPTCGGEWGGEWSATAGVCSRSPFKSNNLINHNRTDEKQRVEDFSRIFENYGFGSKTNRIGI